MAFKQLRLKNIFPGPAYALFGVFILYFFIYFLNYHYHIMACPYPLEYREGSHMVSTELLLEGKNPFDYANNPQYANGYGIFYNLIVLPFAKIWGPTLLVHRIATGFFVFACCLIIVGVLRKNKAPWILSLAAGIVLYPFLLFPESSTPLAGPHSLGVFLFLMTCFIPYFCHYSKTSLGLSILSGILAFYTKQYFLLGIPLTASYIFLFESKKKGILYGLIFLIIFIISIFVVNRIMNCYFNNVFLSTHGSIGDLSVAQAVGQLQFFYALQKPFFALLGIYCMVQGVLWLRRAKTTPFKAFFSSINLSSWQAPLCTGAFNLSLYGLIISTLTIYFLLGRNTGQFMPYLYQLMSPFFVLCVFHSLGRQRWITFVGMALIILNLFTLSFRFPKNFHAYDKNWQIVEGLFAFHKNIFASPLFVPLLLKYHCPVYDSGLSEYFKNGENPWFFNIPLPVQPKVKERVDDALREVWDMMAQKKFDFIIIIPNYHPFLSNYCTLYYRPIGAIKLNNFQNAHEGTDEFVILVPK